SRRIMNERDPKALRKMVASSAKRMPALPDFVSMKITKVDGVPAAWFDTPGNDPSRVILYLHGGGYMFCSALTTHRDLLWRLSQAAECRVLAIDYRLAPENPFPA